MDYLGNFFIFMEKDKKYILILSLIVGILLFILFLPNHNFEKEGYTKIVFYSGNDHRHTHWGKNLIEDGNCISFTNYNGDDIKFCGTYEIVKKNEKK